MGILTTGLSAGKAAAAAARAEKLAAGAGKLKGTVAPARVGAQAPAAPTHVAKSGAELSATRAGKLAEAKAAMTPAQEILKGGSFSAVADKAEALMVKFDSDSLASSVTEWMAIRKSADLSLKNPGALTPHTAAVGAKIREFLSFGVGPTDELLRSRRPLSLDVNNPGWKSTSLKMDRSALEVEALRKAGPSAKPQLEAALAKFRMAQQEHLVRHDPKLAALFKERAQLQRTLADPKLPQSVRSATADILQDVEGNVTALLRGHETQNYGEALVRL